MLSLTTNANRESFRENSAGKIVNGVGDKSRARGKRTVGNFGNRICRLDVQSAPDSGAKADVTVIQVGPKFGHRVSHSISEAALTAMNPS